MKRASKSPHRDAFRRKWWQLIVLVLAFSSAAAQSDQNRYAPINGYGFKYKRLVGDSLLLVPLYASPHTPYRAGAIKYRESDSSLYKWTGTQWLKEGGSGDPEDTFWELNGSNNLVNKTFPGSKIEINKRLSILDSGFVASGPLSGTNPGEGTGYKFFWYQGKAAVRAGYTDASSFNDAFIGQYSSSFGYNSTATGIASFAVGIGVLASGQASAAWGGSGTQATGNNSTAGGLGSVSGGLAATAFGNSANAPGAASFAAGFGPSANGVASVALNQTTRADGNYSVATGEGSDVNAQAGFVGGYFNQTNYSLVIPQFVIGRHSDTTIGAELFRIGWGSHVGGPKANIFTVDTAGTIRITEPEDATTGYTVLVYDPVDKKVKQVDVGDIGASDVVNTEIDLTLESDTSTTGGVDTLRAAYQRFSTTRDKRVEHAWTYTSFTDGNNANSGETESLPKQTIAATSTALHNVVYAKGRAYGVLQANNLWREQFDASLPNIGLGAYGLYSANYKLPPIITGADIHNSGWTLDGGATYRYKKDITLSIGSNFGYDYPLVVEIDTILEKTHPFTARRYLQAVSSTALVESTQGSFYHANLTNPVTIYIHSSDNSVPGSSKYRYEVSVRRNCISASTSLPGLNIQNLVLYAPGGGYGQIGAATAGGSSMPYVSGTIFSGVGTHAIVSQGGLYENNVFMSGVRGLNAGSIAGAFYKDNGTGIYGIARKNVFLDLISAWTAHESGSISSKLERIIYADNYWFSDTTYAGTVFGSEFVRRVDITGNYVQGAANIVISAADTLNIVGNVFRTITNKSNTATSTNVFSTWKENLLVFNPPSSGLTRTAIESVQTADSFVVVNNVVHMNSPNNQAEASQVIGRTSTAGSATPTRFSYNIIIGQAPATRYTKVVVTDQNSTAGVTSGFTADYNVYILLSGAGFQWTLLNPNGGGSPNSFTLSDWQTRSGREANSIFIDLSANANGLRDIFVDPDNGNWTLTNSANANLVRAVGAGLHNPPTFYPARPSYEQAVETALREDNTSPYASWQYGGTYGGSGSTADGSETKVTAGTNVTVTGSGTIASPYVVNATGAAATDTSRLWHISGNTIVNPRNFGALDIATIKFIMNGDFAGALRTTKQWLFGEDSTGVTNTMNKVVIKSTAAQPGLGIVGVTNGTSPAVNVQTTNTATANNQILEGLTIQTTPATGGFTGVSYRPLKIFADFANANSQFYLRNTASGGTGEFLLDGSNGQIRLTTAGVLWAAASDLTLRPQGASNYINFQSSTGVTGMTYRNGVVKIGANDLAARKLEIVDNAAAQLRLSHTAATQYAEFQVNGSGNLFLTSSNSSPLFGLGGTTSSFPALLRDGASIQVKLADGSANANLKVLDQAYNESTWNGNDETPTKNSVRDEIENNKYRPYSQTAQCAAATSDATPTNMNVAYGLTTLPNNSSGWIKVHLVGNGSSGASTHNIHGIKYYSYHKSGGTLTLDAADVIVADKKGASVSSASWQVIVSSNQPAVEVTGVAATTMNWAASIEILLVIEN